MANRASYRLCLVFQPVLCGEIQKIFSRVLSSTMFSNEMWVQIKRTPGGPPSPSPLPLPGKCVRGRAPGVLFIWTEMCTKRLQKNNWLCFWKGFRLWINRGITYLIDNSAFLSFPSLSFPSLSFPPLSFPFLSVNVNHQRYKHHP